MMTSPNGNIFRVTGPCAGNSPATGEFPTQRPMARSFDVFFDLHLNQPVRRHHAHYDVTVMANEIFVIQFILDTYIVNMKNCILLFI